MCKSFFNCTVKMIGNYMSKAGMGVSRQVGVPLSKWWGRSGVVVSRGFSGTSKGMPLVAMCWRSGSGGTRLAGYKSVQGICNGCAAGGSSNYGAWLVVSRKFGSQSVKGKDDKSGGGGAKVFSRWSMFQQQNWKLDNILFKRFKGGYSDFGHNPKPMSSFTWYWSLFLVMGFTFPWINWGV